MSSTLIGILLLAFAVFAVRHMFSETGDGWFRLAHARVRAWVTGQDFDDVLWALKTRDSQEAEETVNAQKEKEKARSPQIDSAQSAPAKSQSVDDLAEGLGFDFDMFSRRFPGE